MVNFEERTIKETSIYKGNITEYVVKTVELPDGRRATREIVLHDDASAVIAFIDGKLLCVEQFRKPLERTSIEIPAGLIDQGETPLEAAQRELEEETAYQAKNWSEVTSFYNTPGFCNEKLTIFEVSELVAVDNPLAQDEDENLRVMTLTLEEAWGLMESGRICDSKTVFALFYWKMKQLETKGTHHG